MTAESHRITWFVTPDGGRTWLRHSNSMRGTWGFDAKCSCGWKSGTGGALRGRVREDIEDHKLDVRLGLLGR